MPKKISVGAKLSRTEEKFCDAFVKSGNATAAAIAAGYKEGSAGVIGHKLVHTPRIAMRIERMQENLAESLGITRYMIANELRKVAFADVTKTRKAWLTLAEFEELSDDLRGAIQSISHEKKKVGLDSVDVVHVTFYNKLEALRQLNEMLGYNAPKKIALTDKEGEPVRIIHEVVFRDYSSEQPVYEIGNGTAEL